jgi:hypothetical protein
MRKIQTILIIAVCFLFVTATVTAQKAKNIMTNADVIEMVKAELPESTIVLAIQQCDPNFDTSTKALIELKKQGVTQKVMDAMFQPQTSPPLVSLIPPNLRSSSPRPPEISNAIATKDIGPLRVVLKSMLPIKIDNGGIGMRCNFEFINLETVKPIVVAMNALSHSNSYRGINPYLRSTLIDENGISWVIFNENVIGGMSKIGVGTSPNGNAYDAAEIATLLSKRDELKSDTFANRTDYPFIFGSMTEMAPEQSITVTMTFIKNNNGNNSDTGSKIFQMATEIVVGSLTAGSKKSYLLYNLIFDRVSPK